MLLAGIGAASLLIC